MNQLEHSNQLVALIREVARNRMQTFDRLIAIATCAFDVQPLQGDVCEFGCNEGATALWLRGLLPDKHLWLYDTFTGQPKDGPGDTFKAGAMAVPRCCVEGIQNATIVEGNILDLSQASTDVPQTIILAHVDLDNREATLHTLNLIWPRMHRFGHIIIDDYHDTNYPGVKLAVDEFSASVPHIQIQSGYGCAGKERVSVVVKIP